MSVYGGFATRSQETTYNKFVFKTIQVFAEEVMRRMNAAMNPGNLAGLDDAAFEKKCVKLYKALRLMEKHKHLEPRFSDAFAEIAKYISQFRKSLAGETASRFSSLGEFMKSRVRDASHGDLDA